MAFKPFKSPLLVYPAARAKDQSTEPPHKRRKISSEDERKPLGVLQNALPPEQSTELSSDSDGAEGHYLVLW